jgi:hypothetical protein
MSFLNNGFSASSQYGASAQQSQLARLREMQAIARADIGGNKTVAEFNLGDENAIAQKLGLSREYINNYSVVIDGHVFLLVDDNVLFDAQSSGKAYWDEKDHYVSGNVFVDDADSLADYLNSPTSRYWQNGRVPNDEINLTKEQLFKIRGYRRDNFRGGDSDANELAIEHGNAFHIKSYVDASGRRIENKMFDNASVFLDVKGNGKIGIESSDSEYAVPERRSHSTPPGGGGGSNNWSDLMKDFLDLFMNFLKDCFRR